MADTKGVLYFYVLRPRGFISTLQLQYFRLKVKLRDFFLAHSRVHYKINCLSLKKVATVLGKNWSSHGLCGLPWKAGKPVPRWIVKEQLMSTLLKDRILWMGLPHTTGKKKHLQIWVEKMNTLVNYAVGKTFQPNQHSSRVKKCPGTEKNMK